jgi:hypothetical protein
MQQHRGHAAALFILGVAVLGILAVSALIRVPRQALAAEAPFSSSAMPFTSYGAPPAADFLADDEETARVTRLVQQGADRAGGALGSSELADFVFWLALAAAGALVAPTARINVSPGPRAPPRALNLKLRRLAWQA